MTRTVRRHRKTTSMPTRPFAGPANPSDYPSGPGREESQGLEPGLLALAEAMGRLMAHRDLRSPPPPVDRASSGPGTGGHG